MGVIRDPFNENYPGRIRAISVGVVLALSLTAFLYPRFAEPATASANSFTELVETIEIPPTEQFDIPPPPARPSIPVESASEDIAEDITIEETDLESFTDWDAPPPPPVDGPMVRFIRYEVPPVPIGGFAAIGRNLVYPEIAAQAGLEGTVVVQAFVDKNGRVTEAFVKEGIPASGMDAAAILAVRKTLFEPAKQRDRPIGVWIAIPIAFQLTE